MPDAPDWRTVYEAIAHGDETHREWLEEACRNLWAGLPVPPPRGTNIDVIERVARAIYDAETGGKGSWEALRSDYRQLAQAALAAILG